MAHFSLIGDTEPFLHCRLDLGETIFCEADAMVMMEEGLELKGEMRGGLFQSLARRFANGESMFQQRITATGAGGDCLLAPRLDGDIHIIEVGGNQQYCVNDGAFVACSSSIEMNAAMNRSITGALFGDTGGFFITKTAGEGQLAVTGMGVIFDIDIEPGKTTTIDNGHVVCWDSSLNYEISLRTGSSGGMMSSIINSVTSAEGVVLKFTGRGKVYISSRNPKAYKSFLQSVVNGGD